MAPNHDYEWWVRTFDAQGHNSRWSPGQIFTAAATPLLLSPSGQIGNLQPALSWSPIPGADHYDLWVEDLTTGVAQAIRNQNVQGATFTPATALTAGDSYEWWVRTFDSQGHGSPWSNPLTFTEATVATPVTIGPRGTGSANPIFTWNAAVGANHYDLWVNDLSTGQGQVYRNQQVAGTSLAVALSLGDQYKWWVRSINSAGVASPWTAGDTFMAVALPAPLFIGPGGNMASLQPAITWTGVAGADHYDLWVNDLTAGTNQLIRTPNVSTTSFTPGSPLKYGHTYRAWVRTVDALGNASDWSLGLDFTVA